MRQIPFDERIERRKTNCSKWDAIPFEIEAEDVIPMWVADMDFACPPAVMDAVSERLLHPVFGYMQFPEEYYSSIIHWQKSRYSSSVLPEEIIPVLSVLSGVAMAVQALSEKGDAVLVPTPGYHAFYNAIINNERRLVASPMRRTEDFYELDLRLFEQQLIDERVKLVLFCSPHNPTGRIFTKEELYAVVEICHRHGVYLVSDEIHADMTLGRKFTTIFDTGEKAHDIALALYSPTKTFNIAGLCTAYAVIKNSEIAKRFNRAILASGAKVKNTLGVSALIGGYQHGGAWVDELQEYILENERYAVEFINKNIPGAHAYLPDATYFLWIDFGDTGFSPEEIIQRVVYGAHVAVTRGTEFIEGGDSFVRMNCACPKSLLKEALERLEKVFDN